MPRVVFSGNRLEQGQLYLAFGGISWAIWGSQSSNRRAASPEKGFFVAELACSSLTFAYISEILTGIPLLFLTVIRQNQGMLWRATS